MKPPEPYLQNLASKRNQIESVASLMGITTTCATGMMVSIGYHQLIKEGLSDNSIKRNHREYK